MADLLVSIFRCGVRQDDIRMIGVVELWACSYLPPTAASLPCQNHGPTVKISPPRGSVNVGDRDCISQRCVIEPINRNFGDALSFQKDVNGNLRTPSTLCVTTGKHTPAKIFLVLDLVRDRHASALFSRSSSARASLTNPSGSPRASE